MYTVVYAHQHDIHAHVSYHNHIYDVLLLVFLISHDITNFPMFFPMCVSYISFLCVFHVYFPMLFSCIFSYVVSYVVYNVVFTCLLPMIFHMCMSYMFFNMFFNMFPPYVFFQMMFSCVFSNFSLYAFFLCWLPMCVYYDVFLNVFLNIFPMIFNMRVPMSFSYV